MAKFFKAIISEGWSKGGLLERKEGVNGVPKREEED